jgi:hypothetical protein
MAKKRMIAWGFVAGCVCLAPAVVAWLPIRGVTSANFGRIETGMRMRDVLAIFGKIPSDHTVFWGKRGPKEVVFRTWKWKTDNERAVVIVEFDDEDKVTRKFWVNSSETIWDKFRRWLRLP